MTQTSFLSLILLSIIAVSIQAHPIAGATDSEKFTGPTETKGIASIESRGLIELSDEFKGMQGKQMRAREFIIEPGGVVGLHTHVNRPGYAYILEGTIIEHRNDADTPITHQAGGLAIEQNGVAHWWENASDEKVKALVVDIFTPEEK